MAKGTEKKGSMYDTKQALPKQPYTFPTIGEGITVMASSQEEANAKAAEIKENLEKNAQPQPSPASSKDEDASEEK